MRDRRAVGSFFIGGCDQKVDGKGRMSIPSDFRRVLEDSDPRFPSDTARLILVYGPHLKKCLQVYTVEAFEEIKAGIAAMPRGSRERKIASRLILAHSSESEIDRDGRIVLPKDRREQIGIPEGGMTRLVAMGDYFEMWNKETYDAEAGAEIEEMLEEHGDDFDPLNMVFGG